MFQVNPNSAMTELYGLNKADAQVFDNNIAQQAIIHKQRQQDISRKEKEAKLSSLMSDVSKVGKGEIRPADIDYFANEQKSLYDDVKKAFSETKGGVLPIDKQVDFESRIADIQRKALVSGSRHKQNMAEYQKAVLNPDKFNRQDEIAKIQADSFDKANGGNFNEPLTTLTEHFDYGQHVLKNLVPVAHNIASNNSKQGNEIHTLEDANKMIENDLRDVNKYQQVAYDFNHAKDKLGTDNPIDYAKKLYAPNLVVNKTPKKAEWEVNGSGGASKNDDIRVTHTVKDNSEEYSVQDPKTNEEVVVIKEGGKIVGGIKGGRLTPAEKSERDKVISTNNKMLSDYQKSVNDLKKKSVEEGLSVDEVEAALPVRPNLIPVPFKEKGVEVDAAEAQKLAFNKYGVNIEDLSNGKHGDIKVQPVDARTKNSNTGVKIKVKRKSDGKTGTIDEKDFNPSKYDKI